MGWSPGQRGVWEQQTYRQRHGYGEYTGPQMRPQIPTAPPSTNIPGLPPPPAGGATGSGTAQDVNGRRQYPSQTAGLPTQRPPAPAPPSSQPGQNIIQQGLQQILGGGGESDPYEAWKAGGRQGNRPAGY